MFEVLTDEKIPEAEAPIAKRHGFKHGGFSEYGMDCAHAIAQAQLKQDMGDVIKLIDELDNGMRSSGSWRTKIRELRQELKEKVK